MVTAPQCKTPEQPWPSAPHAGAARQLDAAHARLLAGLAAGPAQPMPLWPDVHDLEERDEDLRRLLRAMWAYVQVILVDVAQNIPRELDLRQIEALSFDLVSKVSGTMRLAATALSWGRP